MLTISNKNNFVIKKKVIPIYLIRSFQKELEGLINKIIRQEKLKIDPLLPIDIKLLAIEEINHKYIAKIYAGTKKFKIVKNFEKNLAIKKILKKFLKKKIFSLTKAIRLDLSNNLQWNLTWHQENSYVGDDNKFIFFWFPILNDNDNNTGGLEIYDKYNSKAYKYKTIKKKNQQTQKISNTKLNKKYFKEVKLKLGDMLIFDKFLFHKSVANNSYKAKLSCVMSFFEKS